MRIKVIIMLVMFAAGTLYGQNQGEWYKRNVESGVYGIELAKANEFLKTKKIKKDPVVAVICAGVDIEHEGIMNSLWTNKKEKKDGIDNDRNGYVDDINGWNFIGSRDGENIMDFTTYEGDREWLRLKDKYADLFFDGESYFKFVKEVRASVPEPQDKEEYEYFRNLLLSRSTQLGSSYGGYAMNHLISEYTKKWDDMLKVEIPDRYPDSITDKEAFKIIGDKLKNTSSLDSLGAISMTFLQMYAIYGLQSSDKNTVYWKTVYDGQINRQGERAMKSYNERFARLGNDRREEIVGDNPSDFGDNSYGNGMLLTAQSLPGTMMSGILINTCPNVRIMPLIALTREGDPYLKDIVNSIRYAVNNGADVIILPSQSPLYPPHQRKWFADAVREAEKKGVLVVVPARENSDDLNRETYYPSVDMDKRFRLNNLMTVANSDSLGMPAATSNYGTGRLDIYAPGTSIYTTTPGDLYRTGSGNALGAAFTAGVAALIKAYMPNLSGAQIRKIIMDNPTSRKGTELEKGVMVNGKPSQDFFLFEQLCTSAGILNANNAVRAAFPVK